MTALIEQDFERLFIDELHWDRFSNRLPISLLAPGQFTQGWLTREERFRKTAAKQIDYPLKGVARIGGQVVFVVTCPTDSIPDFLRRCTIGRKVSRLHYEPIVIYSCPFDNEQVWQFITRAQCDLDFFEHRLDCPTDVLAFSVKLSALAFDLTQRAKGVTSIDLSERLCRALTYRRQKRIFDRSRQTAVIFREFGNGLPELAEIADEHRGLDRDDEAALFEMVRAGSESAKWQLFQSHLYIPLKVGLRTYQVKKLAGRVELADVVSYGIIGLLNAIRLYKPDQSPRFMTYAALWVQRGIDREVFDMLRPFAVPFYAEVIFAPIFKKLDIEVDKLAQGLGRVPKVHEIQAGLGLNDDEFRTLNLLIQGSEPIIIDDSDEELIDACLGVIAPVLIPRQYCSETLESVLACLTCREAEVVRLRYGLDEGKELTLESVASKLSVTRERVRQIELRANKKLKYIGSQLILQGFEYPTSYIGEQVEPDPEATKMFFARGCSTQ
ncbi:MAG: sigma-70 family RNA polymerase sigma factor [Armatimonadetes bacterium]|nr:sigma-70 family RNA polymerase sigma factor [Armatimonadota bacterium]